MIKKIVNLLVLLVSSTLPVAAYSYSVTPSNLTPAQILANLTSQSSLIVSGTVTNLNSRYPEGPNTTGTAYPVILTDVSLIPDTVFKGRASGTVTFVVLGGCVKKDNAIASRDSSAVCFRSDLSPEFKVGEKALLFLKEGTEGLILADPIDGRQAFITEGGRAMGLPSLTFRRILWEDRSHRLVR